MKNYKLTQENNSSQNAGCIEDPQHTSPERVELPIDSLQEETQSFSKNQETGNTKELINILSIIAMRVAAKRQKQEHSDT